MRNSITKSNQLTQGYDFTQDSMISKIYGVEDMDVLKGLTRIFRFVQITIGLDPIISIIIH